MKIQVLDHGYVEFIEAWGTGEGGTPEHDLNREPDFEVGIVEAARQSTQGSFRGWEKDAKLLRTLYHHQPNGSTPFEMAGMTIEVQAPIMVFREWHRHRTQSYNEASARYKPLEPLYYHIPDNFLWERCRSAAENTNRQAASAALIAENQLDAVAIAEWNETDRLLSCTLEDHYQQGLKIGIPKELARKKMPVDHYSCMRASANLRNWLGFMTLRCDSKAQWEIRQFANAVSNLVAEKFPQTWKLWDAGASK